MYFVCKKLIYLYKCMSRLASCCSNYTHVDVYTVYTCMLWRPCFCFTVLTKTVYLKYCTYHTITCASIHVCVSIIYHYAMYMYYTYMYFVHNSVLILYTHLYSVSGKQMQSLNWLNSHETSHMFGKWTEGGREEETERETVPEVSQNWRLIGFPSTITLAE